MATKPDEVAVLDVKLKQLFITCGRTVSVLESKKDIAINRQIESLRALSKDVEQSRREVELLKITKGEEEAEISSWNAEVEEKLSRADEDIKRLEILSGWRIGKTSTNKTKNPLREKSS